MISKRTCDFCDYLDPACPALRYHDPDRSPYLVVMLTGYLYEQGTSHGR